MEDQEVSMPGGNISSVVRVGDTVRRATGRWSRTVHHLLQWLTERGFTDVPRPLGFDDQGREVLTFIEGEVGDYPFPAYMWTDDTLVGVARFLRGYHDATVGYIPPPGAVWQYVYPERRRHEVICHNDFAPYNLVFQRGKPTALIDFDFAGPGPRVWDIAYAVYRFVPLSWQPDIQALGLSDINLQVRRLRLFCDAYGLDDRNDLLDMVRGRLDLLCAYLTNGAARGNEACMRMVEEGHLALYQSEIEAFELHRSALKEFLS
jgi:hypothetical protein